MEQPENYDSEYELIEWLKYDLDDQRSKGVTEDELVLNIGSPIDKIIRIKVNFIFDLRTIISELLQKSQTNKDHKYICHHIINCSDSIFEYETDFSTFIFEKKSCFLNATFKGESSFSKSVFNDESDFSKSVFNKEVYFYDVIFGNKINFSASTFSAEANFKESVFNEKANFSGIKFKNNKEKDKIRILFNSIKLSDNSYISFNNINYDEILNKFTESKNSKIEIIKTVIDGRIDFHNVNIKKINFEGSNVMGSGVVNRINFEAECENSDTARFLKHEEIKRNDTIKVLKYKAIEKELYAKELIEKTDKTFQTWAEIFSINLSKLSNNHGQDWFRAVAFTLISGFFFFSLSVATGVFDYVHYTATGINTFFMGYFNYLIPTNFNLIKCVDTNMNIFNLILFAIFYLLGKISVGYGIVEIVQAFRKFNKVT